MSITVTGIKDQPINISGSDDAIANQELKELGDVLGLSQDFLFNMLNGTTFTNGENVSLETLLDKVVSNVEPKDPKEVEELLAKVKEIEAKLPGLKSAVEAATKNVADKQAAYESAPANQKAAKLKELEEAKKELELAKKIATNLESEMNTAKEQLKQASSKSFMNNQTALKDQIKQATGQSAAQKAATAPGEQSPSPTTPFQSGAGTGGGAAQKAAADGKAGAGDPYSGFGGGDYKAAGPGDGSAMFYTGIGDDFINDSWDMINESQKRQKMLMLFFYYAKMAMSGDIGAMYQFMRFLAHVIGRDKALQNVWMGTKLLELQDASRAATKELLATEVNGDENGEWTKKLQEIKGEEGMIATSQKLITQMMEEFTQIVETLTNVQKSLLDVNGKVLSNLSQWR